MTSVSNILSEMLVTRSSAASTKHDAPVKITAARILESE